MTLAIGDTAPDFEAETTEGKIRFHDWLGNSWGMLFSHPKDFTPVCTTELGTMARLKPEFDKRNTKIIGLSVDPVDNHAKWAVDIKDVVGFAPNYPMIGDTDLKVAKAYGMLPAATPGSSEGRTPADNQTVRNVFIIGPDKKIKLILVYPMSTGRNFDEVLRVLNSLQLTAKHRVATPANWKQGEDVILTSAVSNDEAKQLYPQGFKTPEALFARGAAAARLTQSAGIFARARPLRRALCIWRAPRARHARLRARRAVMDMAVSKAAILGASGPTGFHLAAALRQAGLAVRVVARSAGTLERLFPGAIEKRVGRYRRSGRDAERGRRLRPHL